MIHLFVKVLESENASTAHKELIVNLLRNIAGEPQALVSLFANYDCDLESADIFQRVLNA